MKQSILILSMVTSTLLCNAQNPILTSWIVNSDGTLGRHYVSGNSTPIQDNDSVNVQHVYYSTNWAYIKTKGIPAYVTGPFQDGNPSLATNQNAIFKFPLTPAENTGTPTATTGGNIGVFTNGVALFDYRDGVSWNNNNQSEGGGPIPGPPGQGIWNRDAIVAEREGFDCAKGHPAMGNYHHHQNPSAFDLDITPISEVCNLYDADGLYMIDENVHSPLVGFAYDGFPIYGAYGYLNTDGGGGIVRMKSSYQLRDITARTHYADGTDVTDGPAISTAYPLGRYREDYEYIDHAEPDFLDEHNGRFCVTPEYPDGIYAYFCTVDENWNSAYPYAVGPTFYGVKVAAKVSNISEPVTEYNVILHGADQIAEHVSVGVYPNPSSDLIAIQIKGMVHQKVNIHLYDMEGKLMQSSFINAGSTITYLDTQTLHDGQYMLEVSDGFFHHTQHVVVIR